MVGVTGRTGSGKSLLTAYLAEQGAFVLDADAIYHTLLETDGEMLAQIGGRWARWSLPTLRRWPT